MYIYCKYNFKWKELIEIEIYIENFKVEPKTNERISRIDSQRFIKAK